MEKRFNVFMDENTHILLKIASSAKKVTMNEYAVAAIKEQLQKDNAIEILFPSEKE